MPTYKVFTKEGKELKPGDKIVSFSGNDAVFMGCSHPRKVTVRMRPGGFSQEAYPSVYDLRIEETE